MTIARLKPSPPRFKVGDTVSFRLALDDVHGVITEDRGNLGYGGRRLYGVRFSINPGEELYTEVPEEELFPDMRPDLPYVPSSGARGRSPIRIRRK
jgi:hypothetical protein